FDYREAKPAAAGRLPGGVDLVEPLEDQRQMFVGDARTGVTHGQHRTLRCERALQKNFAAFRSVTQGIGSQVLKGLLETVRISDDAFSARIHVCDEPDSVLAQFAFV